MEDKMLVKTHFDASALSIRTWTGFEFCVIPLEACVTSTDLLNRILHLMGNKWWTEARMEDFFRCLDLACREVFDEGAASLFVRTGVDYTLDWRRGLRVPMPSAAPESAALREPVPSFSRPEPILT